MCLVIVFLTLSYCDVYVIFFLTWVIPKALCSVELYDGILMLYVEGIQCLHGQRRRLVRFRHHIPTEVMPPMTRGRTKMCLKRLSKKGLCSGTRFGSWWWLITIAVGFSSCHCWLAGARHRNIISTNTELIWFSCIAKDFRRKLTSRLSLDSARSAAAKLKL